MAYYSIVAVAKQPVGIPKPMVMLDAGVNVFTVVVDNIDEFVQQLKDEGVSIQQMNKLDVSEPAGMADIPTDAVPLLGGDDGIES